MSSRNFSYIFSPDILWGNVSSQFKGQIVTSGLAGFKQRLFSKFLAVEAHLIQGFREFQFSLIRDFQADSSSKGLWVAVMFFGRVCER